MKSWKQQAKEGSMPQWAFEGQKELLDKINRRIARRKTHKITELDYDEILGMYA